MAVPVSERLSVGIDLHIEYADGLVFRREMVMGFGGDFDFGGGLRGDHGRNQEKSIVFHAAHCSICPLSAMRLRGTAQTKQTRALGNTGVNRKLTAKAAEQIDDYRENHAQNQRCG